MKQFVLFSILLGFAGVLAQPPEAQDLNYLEDQFYVGLTYNAMLDRPQEVNQPSFSYGLQAGFIKDIPLNKPRTFALGLGIGYANNSYYSNIRATSSNGTIIYQIADDIEGFKRSKIETHAVDFPIELRWRNSNASDFKFWRIYPGARLTYVFSGRSKLVTDTTKDTFQNGDIRSFQYGLMFNLGYNTFNLHVYYGLNTLFEDDIATTSGDVLDMKPLRIGLIFYIL